MCVCVFVCTQMVSGEGLVQKGGCPEYHRDMQERGIWRAPFGGNTMRSEWMTEKARGEYGWGAFSDEPFSFGTVELYVTALAWFYDQIIFDAKDDTLNPVRSNKVRRTKKSLEKFLGRGRVHTTPELLRAHVISMLSEVSVARDVCEGHG